MIEAIQIERKEMLNLRKQWRCSKCKNNFHKKGRCEAHIKKEHN